MTEAVGSRWRHVLASACLSLALASSALAQPRPTPLPDPPATPQFMSRYDFHLEASYLGSGDHTRFMWDTHWGGDFDLIDYVAGRFGFLVDYQAVLGNEFRPFDPNQGNYVLEFSGSGRLGRTELAGVFHHVSRHLSDRPKRIAVAMNVAEVRLLRRFEWSGLTVDLKAEAGHTLERAYVDYSWTGNIDMTARHRVNGTLSAYGRVFGESYGIDEDLSDRDTQRGGRFEAGIRLRGRGGAMDLFAGWERVIDADPLDRQARSWPFAGFRLVN
jgi:hypothetical protein